MFFGTAQLFQCINTGGNLATLDSAEVDQLLYDLAVSDDVECWIGLEKRTRGNETSIWADGSVSTYRNYPGQTPINDQITEHYSLRARNGNRTSGWEGYNRLETLSCFICQRSGMILNLYFIVEEFILLRTYCIYQIVPFLVNNGECQFTNNDSCYRTFQLVHPTINWYAAQLSCIVWGGNLVSITSETENTILYYRTPYSAENCWIGLTNRNEEGYYWIDGEQSSYNNLTNDLLNDEINIDYCGMNKLEGLNNWNATNCDATAQCYICERSRTAQYNPGFLKVF